MDIRAPHKIGSLILTYTMNNYHTLYNYKAKINIKKVFVGEERKNQDGRYDLSHMWLIRYDR
jgi:hypothetical protein